MKKTTLRYLLFVCFSFFIVVSINSCKKDVIKKDDKRSFKTLMDIDPNLVPDVENGMLVFRDYEHFSNYISYLENEAIAEDTTNPDDTLDADSKLALVEAGLGYTSMRSVLKTEWDNLNEVGWDNVDEIPDQYFIHSIGTRSVYNSNQNVKIGDQINHFYSNDFGILIMDGDIEMLDKVNTLPANLSEDELFSTFAFDDNVRVYSLTSQPAQYEGTFGLKTTQDTTWMTDFSPFLNAPANCTDPEVKVRLKAIGLTAQGVDPFSMFDNGCCNRNKLDIYVDWGDGNTATFTNVLIDIHFNYSFNVMEIVWPTISTEHHYASAGTYTIHIKTKRPYHSTWVAEATHSFYAPTYSCSAWAGKKTSRVWKYSSDGSRAVSGQIDTHSNFFGKPVFEAQSMAWKKIGGKFKNKKADRLVAQIWYDNYWDCSGNPIHHQGAEWPYNDKSTTAHVGGYGQEQDASYEVIYSNHRIYIGSEVVNLDLSLIRCQ